MTVDPGRSTMLEHLRRRYDGVFPAAEFDRHIETYVDGGQTGELLAIVRAVEPCGDRLLDVGCGFGAFVVAAREAGLEAVGIDPAEFDLEYARGRLADERPADDPEATFHQGSALALPYAEGSFDIVTLWNVLEHVPDVERTLSECQRVLGPDGVIIAIAPNYAWPRLEAHYHVGWPGPIPKRLAAAYLRVRGRDPSFFLDAVFPCSNRSVRRAARRAGLRLEDPRARRARSPEAINNRWLRGVLRWAHRVGLGGMSVRLLSQVGSLPGQPTIRLTARKP